METTAQPEVRVGIRHAAIPWLRLPRTDRLVFGGVGKLGGHPIFDVMRGAKTAGCSPFGKTRSMPNNGERYAGAKALTRGRAGPAS
jgi:hypothetical protein